ncbi:actin regulatory protein [Crepidotus variabilis]|uniref:Actin regulatory protein n=1 Tax=Crepidotus variabilis TaxID=179855 RepID=A0A9P6EQK8_9AGAR|nr:actin regulatory protein [Crepidotus variabilis]
MAHLTKPKTYDIEDSNIALLGSDLEKHVREQGGDTESAWNEAGIKEGLQIWRIEKFHVKPWSPKSYGSFYDGDSYIVLHTFKKTLEAESFSYDAHFWLGQNTSQDEAGTAAYKTVELDDHLHGKPVQWREVQGYESPRFLSYFPRFVCLRGGVSTGFHHVTELPPEDIKKLYRVNLSRLTGGKSHLVVREVPAEAESLVEGDVYVLDKGVEVLQFNTKSSVGQEKFKAAEFARSLVDARQGRCDLVVHDEGSTGSFKFLHEFGEDIQLRQTDLGPLDMAEIHPTLYRISDTSGTLMFDIVQPPTRASLSSQDAFLLDHSAGASRPAIYVWIGNQASLNEKRMAIQYAQQYLYDKKMKTDVNRVRVTIPVVKMVEGQETADFLEAI